MPSNCHPPPALSSLQYCGDSVEEKDEPCCEQGSILRPRDLAHKNKYRPRFGLDSHGCARWFEFKITRPLILQVGQCRIVFSNQGLDSLLFLFWFPIATTSRGSGLSGWLSAAISHPSLYFTSLYLPTTYPSMEDTNSCPAFIERPEGPFSTTFELQHSPNLSRLSMRFGSSALLGEDENDENDENISPLRLDTPPTPPYRKYSRRSPKRTPPSPTVLKGILNVSTSSLLP